jgi:hypothetical protein
MQVLERMFQFYGVKIKSRGKKRLQTLFESYPFIGLLNAAVSFFFFTSLFFLHTYKFIYGILVEFIL